MVAVLHAQLAARTREVSDGASSGAVHTNPQDPVVYRGELAGRCPQEQCARNEHHHQQRRHLALQPRPLWRKGQRSKRHVNKAMASSSVCVLSVALAALAISLGLGASAPRGDDICDNGKVGLAAELVNSRPHLHEDVYTCTRMTLSTSHLRAGQDIRGWRGV